MNTEYQSSQLQNDRIRQALDAYVSWSQVAIWILILIAGAVFSVSAIGFLFNLSTNWPGTEIPTIRANPWWMVGHLVRAASTGYVAIALFRYVVSIRSVVEQTEESLLNFMQRHSRVWFRSAVALAILFVYASYYGLVVVPSIGL